MIIIALNALSNRAYSLTFTEKCDVDRCLLNSVVFIKTFQADDVGSTASRLTHRTLLYRVGKNCLLFLRLLEAPKSCSIHDSRALIMEQQNKQKNGNNCSTAAANACPFRGYYRILLTQSHTTAAQPGRRCLDVGGRVCAHMSTPQSGQ